MKHTDPALYMLKGITDRFFGLKSIFSVDHHYSKKGAIRFLSLLAICLFFNFLSAFAAKYYVSTTGDDANSNSLAQTIAGAWATITNANTRAALGDTVVVMPGTYSETNIAITKRLKIYGNEVGGELGVGDKPVFNGASSTPSGSIFIIQSTDVVIKNLEIQVDQVNTIRGIFSSAGGFNRIRIEDNHIFSTNSVVPSIFNSYGIQLGTPSTPAGADSFLIVRNKIRPLTAGSATFGRGIRNVGGFGRIGSSDPADSNVIAGDYGVQAGDINRAFQLWNNKLYGRSACLELNIPATNRTHIIEGNEFRPLPGVDALSMVELKNNTRANSIIRIKNNRFEGHSVMGLFSTRSRNVQVLDNIFIPSDTAKNYRHIVVNTKQQTSGNDAATNSSITITGNTLSSNGNLGGRGIVFENHHAGANPPFSNIVIGGAGTLANQFSSNLRHFVFLDTATGSSKRLPLWDQPSYPITNTLPVSVAMDIQSNLFSMGSGLKLPSDLSDSELIALENRLVHKMDFDSLGFLTVLPNAAFLTQTSFVAPKTTTPSIQRAIALASDGWKITAESGSYAGTVSVNKSLDFNNEPNQAITLENLTMNGAGKSLTFADSILLTGNLTLANGIIQLDANPLIWENTGSLTGGSQSSHFRTTGTGQLIIQNVNASRTFHIGTAASYFPVTLSNTGTSDWYGLRVQNDVLDNGLTGIPVDSVVGATWVISEGVSGGSNLSMGFNWAGANEKPFFERNNAVLQGFSGSWSQIASSPVAALGSDPYTITFNGISTDFNSKPIRIRTSGEPVVPGRLYYVDNASGLDSRTNIEAKNPNTPWKTIANAIANTTSGDSIQVFAGTYTEFDLLVNKSLTILGNVVGVGVGPGAGTGIRPIINGVGPSPLDSSIFIVRATNVNIRNFNIKVDIDKIKIGINAPVTGFGGLVIEDNLIESTADIQSGGIDVVVLSHAILLGRLIGANGNGNDSIICRRNIIDREGPDKKWFSRGIRWWGGRGMVGGNNPADGNIVHADFAIQLAGGNTGGRIQTRNNTIFGRAAGVEYNTPPPTFRHTIANNTIRPLDNSGHFALIEIKSNIRTTGPTAPVPPFIDIENNTLEDFYNIGVALTRSRKCNVVNNTFTPRADSTRYTHVWVNSKQRTAGTAASQPPLALIETLIQGNTFNSNNVVGGYGVAFQNANAHSSGNVFTVSDMGGPGPLANSFGPNIAKVVYLDTITGPSSDDSFWSKPGVNWLAWPSTPTGPVRDNFNFSENIFDVGSGPKRPAAMTKSELLQLEDRVVHKIDADTLGFVTMVPNNVYVTQQSFISPLTTSPRLQRAIDAAGPIDGFTVNIETGVYSGQTTVSQDMTFDATPDGEVSSDDLGINGGSKTLQMADAFKVSGSLRLENGLIDISNSNFSVSSSASITGGSLLSHVNTSGTGNFIHENLGATQRKYPIGTGSRYAETSLANSGTVDNIGLRVRNDVLSGGFTGSPVDTVVNFTYQIKEETNGGSNLNFSPIWTASDERPIFDRNLIFVERHNGSNWVNVGPGTPSVATGSDPFSVTVPISGTWSEQALRVVGRGIATPVGNLYYVDDNSGDDTRTNTEAKNPNTPWKTLTNALAKVDDGDSIQVFFADYNESNLRVLKSVKIFGNVVGIGTGPGAGTGAKPVINGSSLGTDSTIFYVQAPNVQIQNFQIEVNQTSIKHGIYGPVGNFNNLQILNNTIYSVANQSFPGLPCVVFNSYGMRFLNGGTDSVIIKGNQIVPKQIPQNCAFGRGIRGFQGGRFVVGGPLDSDTNTIAAFYGVQLGNNNGLPSIIQNNAIAGNCVEINSPAANSGTHQVVQNRFFAGIPQAILALVELKNIQNSGTGVNVEGNRFFGHSNLAVFSTRSQNVRIANNTFIPADTAKNFRHIHVNTKQQTVAINQPPVQNSIIIVGNDFRGTSTFGGYAIEFANHNDDPGSSTAFSNVVIGGVGAEANTFGARLTAFLRLDPLTGPSASTPLWNGLPTTTMAAVSDNFDIQNNLFGVSGGVKAPSAFTDSEQYEVEDRVIHKIDYDSIGFATWNPNFAYVSNNSFLSPLTTTPSLQRAVDAADSSDAWQINIQPSSIDETVTVSKSIIWNTFPGDSLTLSGIAMNGLGKTLTLTDRFLLTSSLDLSNPNGGLINVGNNDLVALSTATVSQGSINSYVISNGTGGFIRRGVDDQVKFFPIGTQDSYAPVRFQDGNNTGDNFKMTVRPAATPADFTPPLPTGISTHVKFQWEICEAVPGGSEVELLFDWVDPTNVNGSGVIDGIARFNGTDWTTVSANLNGLTARAQGFTDFCSPFAVVSDPTLTTITTQNIIKINPGVDGRFCLGDSILIPFQVSGSAIVDGNVFNAFLSDETGSFLPSGGVLIGSLSSSTSDTIIGVIPASTPPGLNYHIRVVSTVAPITGLANPDSIKVFGLPVRPQILGDSTLCGGSSLTIRSTPAANYLWAPGGQITDSLVVVASGSFTVSVSDLNGCRNTSSPRNVNLVAPPVAEPISFAGSLTKCQGDSIILTANPASFAYEWLPTNPIVTTQNLVVKTGGTFSVIIKNAAGCADTSAPVTTVFNPLPAVPVISSPNLSVCQPGSLEFNGPAGFSYLWSGTGITPTPSTQNVQITVPGSYTVALTVTDGNLCSNTSTTLTGELKAQPKQPAIVALAGDLSICEGDSIKLQAAPFFTNNTYTWSPSSFVGPILTLTNPGLVSITLSVDSNGCTSSGLQAVSANINPRPVQPTVTILNGASSSFCSGDSVVLVSSVAPGYLWNPGGQNSQSIVVKNSGVYSVVTLSDSGCTSLVSESVTIDSRPLPSIPVISANRTEFCAGQTAVLSVVTPIDGNTYVWLPSGSGNSIEVSAPGLYQVRSDSTNSCSSFSNIIELIVNPLPEPVISARDGKNTVCFGDTILLTSSISTGNVWSTGETTQSIVLVQGALGVTLTVTDSKGCSATAGPVQTEVFPLPSVNLLSDTAIVIREDVDLVAIPSTGSVQGFDWFAGTTFLANTSLPAFNVKPEISGYYKVVLTDLNGCRATDSVLVRVARQVYVPNMISPNGDGRNDNFKVYGFGVKEIEVRIWDRLGNLVYETTNVDEIVETSPNDDSVPGWNGKYKDKEVSEESYIWSVKGKFTTNEDIEVTGGKNSGTLIIIN